MPSETTPDNVVRDRLGDERGTGHEIKSQQYLLLSLSLSAVQQSRFVIDGSVNIDILFYTSR